MYNRYIPGSRGYTRVVMDEESNKQEQSQSPKGTRGYTNHPPTAGSARRRDKDRPSPFDFLGGEDKNAGIAGILKSLHLEDLDSGDILLLLIILFVFLEGDNIELVITLGLMLLLGLGDERQKDQKE